MKYLQNILFVSAVALLLFLMLNLEKKMRVENKQENNTTYYASTVFGPVVCKQAIRAYCGLSLEDCSGLDGTPFPNLKISCATNVGSEK